MHLSLLSLPLFLSIVSATYENTLVSRNYELGGSISSITTTYNIKYTQEGTRSVEHAEDYELVIGSEGEEESAWWDISVGGKRLEGLVVRDAGVEGSYPTLSIPSSLLLLKPSKSSSSSSSSNTFDSTIILTQSLAHHSRPLPVEIAQDDPQNLVFERNGSLVESRYASVKMNVKYRAPGRILSHSPPTDSFTRDQSHKKVGSALTLGPYYNVPALVSQQGTPVVGSNGSSDNLKMAIHYVTEEPVLAIRELKRWAEVSQWGGNLNLEDRVRLVNDGPRLKGHFSRIEFQMARFRPTFPAQILRSITLSLPPNAHDPYYYDIIGNVSTSNFRPSNPLRSSSGSTGGNAVLELKPRYPMLGGWEYDFTVGWDNPLGQYLSKGSGGVGEMSLRVPFLTGLRDVVVDEAEVVIVLPEGATEIRVFTPFPVESIEHSIHKTYLDTIGRPKITLRKRSCTEKHEQDIYITYTYPPWALWQKPLTVAAVCSSLFAFAVLFKRLEFGFSSVTGYREEKKLKVD